MNKLEQLRMSICKIDADIIELVSKRQQLATQIGEYKRQNNLVILDPGREMLLREFHAEECAKQQLSLPLARKLFDILIEESRKAQQNEQ